MLQFDRFVYQMRYSEMHFNSQFRNEQNCNNEIY